MISTRDPQTQSADSSGVRRYDSGRRTQVIRRESFGVPLSCHRKVRSQSAESFGYMYSDPVGRKGSTSGDLFERGFIYQRDPAEDSHPLIDRLFLRQVPGPVTLSILCASTPHTPTTMLIRHVVVGTSAFIFPTGVADPKRASADFLWATGIRGIRRRQVNRWINSIDQNPPAESRRFATEKTREPEI